MNRISGSRWLPAGTAALAGVAMVLVAVLPTVLGCSGVAKTLKGGEAAAYATAVRKEERARALEDRAERRAAMLQIVNEYAAIIADDPTGSFADRARFQAAQIEKEMVVPGGANYDRAVTLLQEIIDANEAGYLAGQAKSTIAAIRKNRQQIRDSQRIFDNTPADADVDRRRVALESLRDVARSYESLRDYDSAVERYRQLVDASKAARQETSDVFEQMAAQAQYQIGNIYFYGLYDYTDGWTEFGKVVQEYPKSFEADRAGTLLIQTKEALDQIYQDQEYIRSKRRAKADDYLKIGRTVLPNELYGVYVEQVAQYYLNIAQAWAGDPLKNRPAAIKNYRALVDECWSEMFVASDGMFQIAYLYQDDGQYTEAIAAYDNLFEDYPQSFRRGDAVYNQAVCYETIREFDTAYKQYKAAMSLGQDTPFYRAAEQKVRQMEVDGDGDGYKLYQEQQGGTSDKDPNEYPGSRTAQASTSAS